MAIEPCIKCSDIQASLTFYTEVLDFMIKVAPDTDENVFMSKYALLNRDNDNVHLSSHEGDGVFGNLIYVRVENVDKLYRDYISRGLNTEHPDDYPALTIELTEQTWGMKEFSVRDPDGNKITFGQPLGDD